MNHRGGYNFSNQKMLFRYCLREALNTGANTEEKREKTQALSLAKECYSMKLDLQ